MPWPARLTCSAWVTGPGEGAGGFPDLKQRDMTGSAFPGATEGLLSALGRLRVERARRWLGGRNGQLIKLQRGQLGSDQALVRYGHCRNPCAAIGNRVPFLSGESKKSPLPCISKLATIRVRVRSRAPSGPCVPVYTGQAECGRDQDRRPLAVGTKGFALEGWFSVEVPCPRPVAAADAKVPPILSSNCFSLLPLA